MQACPRLSQQCFRFMEEGELPTENQLCTFWSSRKAAELFREGGVCARACGSVCMRARVCIFILQSSHLTYF